MNGRAMIARRDLPQQFRDWNIAWGAPFGRRDSSHRKSKKKTLAWYRTVCEKQGKIVGSVRVAIEQLYS